MPTSPPSIAQVSNVFLSQVDQRAEKTSVQGAAGRALRPWLPTSPSPWRPPCLLQGGLGRAWQGVADVFWVVKRRVTNATLGRRISIQAIRHVHCDAYIFCSFVYVQYILQCASLIDQVISNLLWHLWQFLTNCEPKMVTFINVAWQPLRSIKISCYCSFLLYFSEIKHSFTEWSTRLGKRLGEYSLHAECSRE